MTVSDDDFARWRSDPVTQAFFAWIDYEIHSDMALSCRGPDEHEPSDVAAVRWGRLNGGLMALEMVKNVNASEINDVRHD
jgi:hypothetical protein